MISDCPKADFSPEKVSLAPSNLYNTFSHPSMCVVTNFRHSSGSIVSSFSSTGHPLIMMSSKNGVEIFLADACKSGGTTVVMNQGN